MSKPRPLSRLGLSPTVTLNLRVPPEVKARLQDYADRRAISMTDVVLMAVANHLAEHDPQELRPRGK